MPATSFRLCPDKRLKNKKSRKAFALQDSLRKDRDSNPGNLSVQRFSRPPQSTTLPSLLVSKTGAKVDGLFELCKHFVSFLFTFSAFHFSFSDFQTHKNMFRIDPAARIIVMTKPIQATIAITSVLLRDRYSPMFFFMRITFLMNNLLI